MRNENNARRTKQKQVHTRNRKQQGWNLGALRGHQRVLKCVYVCVCVTAVLSSGCAQTVCVFDRTQLLEKQTQSVHPDVDRCAVTSSGTHMHIDT